jgi:hypothetical protein
VKLRLLTPVPFVIAILATVAIVFSGPASAGRLEGSTSGGLKITVTMTGAAERPDPGDPDGTGTASFTFNHGLGEVCYSLEVSGIAPATAAHIHIAPVTDPGPVVIPLAAPTSGSSSGCVSADQDLIKAIILNPENYYVNVHNADFGPGAIRAQLG